MFFITKKSVLHVLACFSSIGIDSVGVVRGFEHQMHLQVCLNTIFAIHTHTKAASARKSIVCEYEFRWNGRFKISFQETVLFDTNYFLFLLAPSCNLLVMLAAMSTVSAFRSLSSFNIFVVICKSVQLCGAMWGERTNERRKRNVVKCILTLNARAWNLLRKTNAANAITWHTGFVNIASVVRLKYSLFFHVL